MFKRIRRDVGLVCKDKSRTEAHHLRRCDINSMVNRLMGGDVTVLNNKPPIYADVSEIPDNLQAIFNHQIDARRGFESLPENVRRRYPTAEEFYHAVNDPNSRATFEELGLIVKPTTPEPVKVEVVNKTPDKTPDNVSA